jgi:hypothetical protein
MGEAGGLGICQIYVMDKHLTIPGQVGYCRGMTDRLRRGTTTIRRRATVLAGACRFLIPGLEWQF